MEQSAGTDVTLSLFGGLCSQTASPLLLCIWLARMAKGKGYKYRVGASLHFLSSMQFVQRGAFSPCHLASYYTGGVAVPCRQKALEAATNVTTEELLTFVLHVTYMYTACM